MTAPVRVLLRTGAAATLWIVTTATSASAQASARPFAITDNSFFVEEAFNQERGVFQNIFTWTRDEDGGWESTFTQEWPAPAMRHQLSYTLPVDGGDGGAAHVGTVLLNYRFQAIEERPGRPAFAPRVSVVLPTGRSTDDGNRPGMQVNLPLSKQLGAVYVHGNAGFTWIHGVPDAIRRSSRLTPQIGGSLVWRMKPMVNPMLESVAEWDDRGGGRVRETTVSPGVRGGWNFGDKQLIVGAALPITRSEGGTSRAVLTYLSYELPFLSNP